MKQPSGMPCNDTAKEAEAVQLELLRRMSPQQRIAQMLKWSWYVKQMAFEAIRRRHPEWKESEVQSAFIELAYGQPLADAVREWRKARPNE
jgi:hypothetical protein